MFIQSIYSDKHYSSSFKTDFNNAKFYNQLLNKFNNSQIVTITKKAILTAKNSAITFIRKHDILTIIAVYVLVISLIYSIVTGSIVTGLILTGLTVLYIIAEFLAVYIFTGLIMGSIALIKKIKGGFKK